MKKMISNLFLIEHNGAHIFFSQLIYIGRFYVHWNFMYKLRYLQDHTPYTKYI